MGQLEQGTPPIVPQIQTELEEEKVPILIRLLKLKYKFLEESTAIPLGHPELVEVPSVIVLQVQVGPMEEYVPILKGFPTPFRDISAM